MKEILTTLIGKDLAMVTARWVISKVRNEKGIKTIELKAMGKKMAKAIDVLEILKRELKIDKASIETHTAEVINEDRMPQKISVITIKLERK